MRTYYSWKGGEYREVKGEIVREQPLTVYVNGQKFITLLCTPRKLDALVVGYLWLEKIIASVDEIKRLAVSEVDGRAEVDLVQDVELPTERILTSGCGGGITADGTRGVAVKLRRRRTPDAVQILRGHVVRGRALSADLQDN